MKKFLLKFLVVLSLGMVASGSLLTNTAGPLALQPVMAATDVPSQGEHPKSAAGWSIGPIFGAYLISNGLTKQPADVNFVKGTTASASMVSTFSDQWVGGYNITSVNARVYQGNGQWANAGLTSSIAKSKPTATIAYNLSNLDVGTYYFQFSVTYSSGTTSYSDMITVNVAAAPKDAESIRPAPKRSTIFWGESTAVDANLLPPDSTSVVTWTPPAATTGSLSPMTGLTTSFASAQIDANAADTRLNYDNGLPVTIGANATNTVVPGTIGGTTQVTVGGLVRQDAIAGRSFSYSPAALNDIVFPEGMTPSYQWTVYNANRQKVSTSAVLNNPSFSWANVAKPPVADRYYLQLNIILKSGSNTVTWRSNLAPLVVMTPASRLIAVPNLRFLAYVNGAFRTPLIGDFYQAGGVTLRYSAAAAQVGNGTYDGNNTGFLAVQTVGQNWNLSVQASGFTHQLSGLSLPTNPTLTLAVLLANGGSQVVAVPTGDAAAPVTVLANQTTNYSGNLNSATTLQVPQTSFMLTGNYQSNLTWTLTQAP
ncbi:WxL domain-containing protein [Schleiferilactobacillus harbinensis]|uniref:hypothetical protein n=1 Tax=Schleiferilactobacillus harbinensis TaxID=304207 RepID=UPI00186B4C80|nr:hypothetical protein [Schleiferilactobacillus harbinensis]